MVAILATSCAAALIRASVAAVASAAALSAGELCADQPSTRVKWVHYYFNSSDIVQQLDGHRDLDAACCNAYAHTLCTPRTYVARAFKMSIAAYVPLTPASAASESGWPAASDSCDSRCATTCKTSLTSCCKPLKLAASDRVDAPAPSGMFSREQFCPPECSQIFRERCWYCKKSRRKAGDKYMLLLRIQRTAAHVRSWHAGQAPRKRRGSAQRARWHL